MTVEPRRVAELIGQYRVRTPQELRRAVEEGLPLAAAERAVRHVFGKEGTAYLFSHIVPRTTYLNSAGRRGQSGPQDRAGA